MKSRYIIIVLAALMLGGCEKVLDIDDSDAHDLMVLNAVPQAGKRAFVNFTSTHFFLDSVAAYPVDGATLTLWVNGNPYSVDSVSRCKYFFGHVLQPLDQLAIDITTPKGNVHAETYVPRKPAVSGPLVIGWRSPTFNFFMTPFTMTDSSGYAEYYNLTVTIRDSGLVKEPQQNNRQRLKDTVSHTYFALLNNDDITSYEVTPNAALGGLLYSGLMFTDKLIDGRTNYPVNLFIPLIKDTNEIADAEHTFKHWYTITLESITPARMRYLISVAQTNSMTSFFAEQSQPYTNVSGALGIFGGSAKWSYTFDADTVNFISTPTVPDFLPAKLPIPIR